MVFFLLTVGLTMQTELELLKMPLADGMDISTVLEGTKNALLCFIRSQDEAGSILDVFIEAARQANDEFGPMHIVDCSDEGKTICEELEVSPNPYIIHHYADGKFNKDFTAEATLDNILTLMKDSHLQLPWETPLSQDFHIQKNDFIPFLKETKHALVMFMAPWCVHCRNAKPQFLAAAEELYSNPIYAFGVVDCTKDTEFCEDMGIDGYPTFNYYHFFDKVPSVEYLGEHDKSSIIEFMTQMEQMDDEKMMDEEENKEKTEL
ncbi:protein disulfide-isomerase A5-like [Halyomorpha halys]|uniref:protein disulfide-isomerase A5-like n=1 Tax=Halyomorpha halys TaxID=286706 RepID=UPI0034D1E5CC